MQKILITITQAVTVKNILRTGVVNRLLEDPTIEVVLLAPNEERVAYYRSQFLLPRVSYVTYAGAPQGPSERIFSFLKIYTLRTKTTDLRRRMVAHDSGNYLYFVLGHVLNLVCVLPPVRALIRFLDGRLVVDSAARALLREQRPDLVVLTNLFDDSEISLLREAKRLDIKTFGFINSWDRPTTRWRVRLLPDRMAVYNDIVKRDVMRHAGMPAENIVQTGIPQYDRFITEAPEERAAFFARKGLDPNKHLVLVAPMGPTFSDSDWLLIDLLHGKIKSGEMAGAQMLVRFQPNEALNNTEIAARPWLHYDAPGVRFGSGRGGDWDMTEADLRDLNSSLKHAGVLITYTSSISVDAAVCDTPVINVAFLLKPVKEWLKTPTFYYHTEHHSNAVASGGFRLVHSVEELLEWTNRYLADKSIDHTARMRLAQAQNYKNDGHAAVRLADAILKN